MQDCDINLVDPDREASKEKTSVASRVARAVRIEDNNVTIEPMSPRQLLLSLSHRQTMAGRRALSLLKKRRWSPAAAKAATGCQCIREAIPAADKLTDVQRHNGFGTGYGLLKNHSQSYRLFSSTPSTTSGSNNEPKKREEENALALETKESLPADTSHYYEPIDFDIQSRISGDESQIVAVTLRPNQKLRAESGSMLYMTEGIEMNTTLGDDKNSFGSGLKRVMTGQNLFLADFTYDKKDGTPSENKPSGEVALGTAFPSKILKFKLEEYDNKLVCQKGAFLCASADSVTIDMEFTKKFSTGFFGGEGFILQSLTGTGHALLKAGGTVVRKDLKGGESIRVSSGSLVAFTRDVEYDVEMVSGFKNVMFGGEGLFFTTLKGPGTVWLQGMPPDRMISEIARRVPSGGPGIGIPIGMGGLGGGEGGGDESEGGEGGNGTSSVEDMDAAVNADRQATVASSGMMGDDEGGASPAVGADNDAGSSSALFGDAAPEQDTSSSSQSIGESSFGQTTDDFSTSGDVPDMEESASLGDDLSDSAGSFDNDGSGEAGDFDDGSIDFGDEISGGDGGDEGGSSILGKLWDLFTGGDD
jgi:uncharacterized protein (TIGR00266 family)